MRRQRQGLSRIVVWLRGQLLQTGRKFRRHIGMVAVFCSMVAFSSAAWSWHSQRHVVQQLRQYNRWISNLRSQLRFYQPRYAALRRGTHFAYPHCLSVLTRGQVSASLMRRIKSGELQQHDLRIEGANIRLRSQQCTQTFLLKIRQIKAQGRRFLKVRARLMRRYRQLGKTTRQNRPPLRTRYFCRCEHPVKFRQDYKLPTHKIWNISLSAYKSYLLWTKRNPKGRTPRQICNPGGFYIGCAVGAQ